jgi:hypothetical protein
MILANRFPTLAIPLDRQEHIRLKKKVADYAPKQNNGDVLGRVFARLICAFEFQWAMNVFDLVSKHDRKTGKFTEHLLPISELFFHRCPIADVDRVQKQIIECLREGWKLHPCRRQLILGFARRADTDDCFRLWDGFKTDVKLKNGTDEELETALDELTQFENRHKYPGATDQFVTSWFQRLEDKSRVPKWEDRLEERQAKADAHDEKLELIHESLQLARDAHALLASLGESISSLIQVDECNHVEPLLREALSLTDADRIRLINKLIWADLDHLNTLGSISASFEFCFASTDYGPVASQESIRLFARVAESALRMGMLSDCLQATERILQSAADRQSRAHTESLLEGSIARWETSDWMVHVPRDFWRAMIDVFQSLEVKSKLLAALAVRK